MLSGRATVLSELDPEHAPVLGGGGVAETLHGTPQWDKYSGRLGIEHTGQSG